MLDENGLSVITVKKAELLGALKKNSALHRDVFVEAQAGYREAVIRELDAMLAEARQGKQIRRNVQLVEPQDHTRDYSRVIAMLEMCVNEEVKISEAEFGQYVLDDWGWKAQFATSTQSYLNKR